MGVHILIALLVSLQLLLVGTSSAGELCRKCHPTHYVERGSCVSCHRGNPASDRKEIAHTRLVAGRFAHFTLGDGSEVREGVRLLEQFACRRCHAIAGSGNRLAANLDAAAAAKTPDELAESIRKPVQGMPDFHVSDRQITTIVNALLAASARNKKTASAGPQAVHFNRTGKPGQDIFSKRCGPCHSILSEKLGVLGSGSSVGPNLSGLLSPFYPKTFRDREAWSQANLEQWLKNPRAVKVWARMQPVNLTPAELREIETILALPTN